MLLLTMGAGLIVFNGLNLWQVLLVALCAAAVSYGIVGLLTISGQWGGFCRQALTAWVLAIGTGLMFTRAALSPTDELIRS
ncbi:hypothetical protein ASC99_24900 [Kitasatospora sp. Root107]|nr:hypothetical protein ASC99_24900 [Kitasatospora sp. Root107]